ncbi:MAG: AbrB/MazE/SpoVT family DNA-binding domain-containing protein [Nanoarchaeota archaeon]
MEIVREVGKKGQVVIPKDIRLLLGIREKQQIVFEVKNNEVRIKPQQNPKEWLKNFLKYRKKGKELTLGELRRIEEESYDLP